MGRGMLCLSTSAGGAGWERLWPEAKIKTNRGIFPVLEVLPQKGDPGYKIGSLDPCPQLWVFSLTLACITWYPSL